jgi:hypothetical protein
MRFKEIERKRMKRFMRLPWEQGSVLPELRRGAQLVYDAPPMAAKRKAVDLKALRALARIGATDVQIGHCLKVSTDTLARRFRAEIDQARSEGGVWALQRAHEKADRGCWPAIECLLIHLCGWSKAHAEQQVINIVQQNVSPQPPIDLASMKQRVIQAEEFVEKFLEQEHRHEPQLLPGQTAPRRQLP